MTAARQIVPGRTYLLTRRCTQRLMLLRPDAKVEQIYLYCLGDAAARYHVTIHAFVAMSNHQHVLVRDNLGNFPEFLAHFHKLVAKAMNARLDRKENFWSSEQPNAVYVVGPEDRFAKLVYVLANPVAEHLVDRVSEWPGASSLSLSLSGRTMTVRRPSYFRSNGPMPETVTLELERPDGFGELPQQEWASRIEEALRAVEARAREVRAELGRRVLGRKAVLRASPTDQPRTAETAHRLRPSIACKDGVRRGLELARLAAFRLARAAARLRLLAEGRAEFPDGTYLVRWGLHAFRVQERATRSWVAVCEVAKVGLATSPPLDLA